MNFCRRSMALCVLLWLGVALSAQADKPSPKAQTSRTKLPKQLSPAQKKRVAEIMRVVRARAKKKKKTGPSGTLRINVYGLRSDKGLLIILLYDQAKGYPSKPKQAAKIHVTRTTGRKANISFPGVAFGKYAVSVVHDENGNFKMDRNFLNVPLEGFGCSRNVKSTFGPPKFAQARFGFRKKRKNLLIRMQYWK